MEKKINSKHIVFFDGDCGFCNFWIQWILENDKKDVFLFASLQSRFGQDFLKERGLNIEKFDTIYLWKPDDFYLEKSQAIFRIASLLGGVYKIALLGKLIPSFLGDFFYDIVSKNRMKITAQKCFLPNKKQREKMIDLSPI